MKWGFLVAALAAVAACTERLTAPGPCPDFCPPQHSVRDTVLGTALDRDTAFRGYVRPHEALALPVADLPAVRSRALVRTLALLPPTVRFGTDTTQHPIVGVDSLRLELVILRPDTTPLRNLRLHLYRVPKSVDSTTTYADVTPSFSDSLVRIVNLDSLLALPVGRDTVLDKDVRRDSVTGDYLEVDTLRRRMVLNLKLDSAQAPYVPTDSGRLAFGFAVAADSLASIVLGSQESGTGAVVRWFARVDSAGVDTVARQEQPEATEFDTFVFDPPLPPLDSTLAVGGVPSARSLLRVTLPPAIRDSAQIIRATLLLVPDGAPQGVPADSFLVAARRVLSDLGAKSPLAEQRFGGDSAHVALAWVRIGSTDSVRIDVTRLVRFWAADTTAPTAFMLQQTIAPTGFVEGATFAEIRFKPSSDAAFRPALHITYVPRYRFGVP